MLNAGNQSSRLARATMHRVLSRGK